MQLFYLPADKMHGYFFSFHKQNQPRNSKFIKADAVLADVETRIRRNAGEHSEYKLLR